MAKARGQIDRVEVSADKFREIAAAVRSYADIYENIAEGMDAEGVELVPATGIASLEKRSLTELRGNAMKAMGTFMRIRDEAVIASSYAKKVDKATDSEKPLKKMPKRGRKND